MAVCRRQLGMYCRSVFPDLFMTMPRIIVSSKAVMWCSQYDMKISLFKKRTPICDEEAYILNQNSFLNCPIVTRTFRVRNHWYGSCARIQTGRSRPASPGGVHVLCWKVFLSSVGCSGVVVDGAASPASEKHSNRMTDWCFFLLRRRPDFDKLTV